MNTAFAFLAVVPNGGHPDFLSNLSFQSAGLAVVLLSLSLLAMVVAQVGRMLNPRKAAVAKAAPAAAPLPAGESGITAETVAVISAAVAVTLHEPHRIVQIQPSSNPWVQAWSAEGRRQIFQSHHVR